jgi:hypothetical protein
LINGACCQAADCDQNKSFLIKMIHFIDGNFLDNRLCKKTAKNKEERKKKGKRKRKTFFV